MEVSRSHIITSMTAFVVRMYINILVQLEEENNKQKI